MDDKYKELIDFKYLSDDQKVLVLGYYGGLGGYNLSYYARNHISLNFDFTVQSIMEFIRRFTF